LGRPRYGHGRRIAYPSEVDFVAYPSEVDSWEDLGTGTAAVNAAALTSSSLPSDPPPHAIEPPLNRLPPGNTEFDLWQDRLLRSPRAGLTRRLWASPIVRPFQA
jgi:hypothetical protein